MAKEFDIYLRKHLVECDLLIRSIIYRDGISVTDRLILEAVLNNYTLQKFAAVQMGSELTSHIDEMQKLCLEKLRMGIQIGSYADFKANCKLYVENVPVIVDTPSVKSVLQIVNEVKNKVVLAADPLITNVFTSAGNANFPIIADTSVDGTIKRSLLRLHPEIRADASITQISQTKYDQIDSSVEISCGLQDLCYQLVFNASTSMEIVSLVLGTEICHSLGVWYDGMTIGSRVTGSSAQKFIAAQSIVSVMQKAVEELSKILYPDESEIILEDFNLEIDMKRYRKLEDIDDMFLSDIDNLSLQNLDFIWLT